MIMKRHRLVLSASFLFALPGILWAQPTAPDPEANAAIRSELEGSDRWPLTTVKRPSRRGILIWEAPLFSISESREQSRSFYRTVFNASEGVPMEWTGDYGYR